MIDIAECKYYLPCGLCELSHERCKQHEVLTSICKLECNHDWYFVKAIMVDPPYKEVTYKCRNCGQIKKERIDICGM